MINSKTEFGQFYKTATIFDPPYVLGGGKSPYTIIKSRLLNLGWWTWYLVKHEKIDGDENKTVLSVNNLTKGVTE